MIQDHGAVSSRFFDLLNSMIYDPVLHSPLDDFVNWIEPKEDIEGQKVFCYILMDQICALMVKVVNCIGCWKKTVKIVFVTQRSDYTTQTEEETHSVLVVVELLVAQLDEIYVAPPR